MCFGKVFGLAPWLVMGGLFMARGRLLVIDLDLCREYLLQLLEHDSNASVEGEHCVVDQALCDLHCCRASLPGQRQSSSSCWERAVVDSPFPHSFLYLMS